MSPPSPSLFIHDQSFTRHVLTTHRGRSQANENKVPTILVYPNDQGSNPSPSSWGFISDTPTEQSAENRETKEWFKTYLDEDQLRQRQAEAKDKSMLPKSVEEVEKWYVYLCLIERRAL